MDRAFNSMVNFNDAKAAMIIKECAGKVADVPELAIAWNGALEVWQKGIIPDSYILAIAKVTSAELLDKMTCLIGILTSSGV